MRFKQSTNRYRQSTVWLCWLSLTIVSLTLGWTTAVSGQNPDVLRNADIVKMTIAQLSPETIVLKIETSVAQFDTSPDALAVLKASGVPDVAIAAMVKASAKTSTSGTSVQTAPFASSSSTAIGQADPKATVYIYRPGKLMGKALEPSVFLDEQKLLDMDNARYLAVKLEPGRHILRSNEKNSEIDQTWDASKTYYVKITIAAGMMKGHGQMGMVTEKLALKEMEKLRPLDRENVAKDYLAVVDFTPLK
jgi:Protein of unknown function (DUF2846)